MKKGLLGQEIIYLHPESETPETILRLAAEARIHKDDLAILDGRVTIKGVVVGDTDEKGISVVTFSNPDFCILSLRPNMYDLEKARSVLATGVWDGNDGADSANGFIGVAISINKSLKPTCQYK